MSGMDEDLPNQLDQVADRIAAVSPAWRLALAPAAASPRVQAVRGGLGLGVETIYEGYALHRGAGRVVAGDVDPDLALLIGDFCYAAGLCDVAAAGDLDAVRMLAGLIADTASMALEQPRPEGSPDVRELRWDDALAMLGPRPE